MFRSLSGRSRQSIFLCILLGIPKLVPQDRFFFSYDTNSSIFISYIEDLFSSFYVLLCVVVFITASVATSLLSRITYPFNLLSRCCRRPFHQNHCLGPRHKIHGDVLVQNRCWFSACAASPAQHTHPVNLYCLHIYTVFC